MELKEAKHQTTSGRGDMKAHGAITKAELDKLVHASQLFDAEGVGAFERISEIYGKDIASALYLAFLHRKFGGRIDRAASMLMRTRVFRQTA